jgi:hypothetical protein
MCHRYPGFTEENMSVFANILNKIFPHDHPAATASGGTVPPAAANAAPAASSTPSGNPTSTPLGSAEGAAGTPATAGAEPARPPVTPTPAVDVAAILNQKQQGNGAALNWRTSIVDLLKLLCLDRLLQPRDHSPSHRRAGVDRQRLVVSALGGDWGISFYNEAKGAVTNFTRTCHGSRPGGRERESGMREPDRDRAHAGHARRRTTGRHVS